MGCGHVGHRLGPFREQHNLLRKLGGGIGSGPHQLIKVFDACNVVFETKVNEDIIMILCN